MTRVQFNKYLHQYDLAGLSENEETRLRSLYASYPIPELVVSSDLPRAKKTADLFARGTDIIVNPVFREIPIILPSDADTWFLRRRWPSEIWWSYLRSAWFFNIPPEGKKLSVERSREAIHQLLEYQKQVQTLALVSHSGFLLVTINLLMKAGQIEGRRLPHINFGKPTTYHYKR